MQWEITRRFLTAIFITLLVSVIFFAIFTLFPMINWGKQPEKSYNIWTFPGNYTLDFAEYISWQDNQIVIKEEGVKELKKNQLWIQVLNEKGDEIYSHFKPVGIPEHYSPGRLVYYHSDSGNLKGFSLVAGLIERGQQELCYHIGFPEDRVIISSYVFNPQTLYADILKVVLRAVIISLVVGFIIAYIFSNRLISPIANIIAGIKVLAQGDYSKKGGKNKLFQEVYKNLNKLASTLKTDEEQRKKTEQIREEWIANITHDIKTPLSSIRGYAEVLCEPDYDLSREEKMKYSSIIVEKANYIKDLTDDLKLTYQLKNDLLPLEKKEENLIDIVRESIITIINNRKDQKIGIDFMSKKEVFHMKCNAKLMQRAFINIIYNAVIHNPVGTSIIVRLGEIENCQGLGIEIEDNGQGIAVEDLDKLFDRYYRGTNTGRENQSSGLGLAIAKQIIEFHGGKIEVKSKLEVGTRVTICFK